MAAPARPPAKSLAPPAGELATHRLLAAELAVTALLALTACDDTGGTRAQTPLLVARTAGVDCGDGYVGLANPCFAFLQSVGTGSVHVQSATLHGDPAFALEPLQPFDLAPGGERELPVTFTPIATGTFFARLTITSDSSVLPTLRLDVHGRAIDRPGCDDANPCTNDAFDEALRTCTHIGRTGACDDGSVCTTGDVCLNDRCVGAALRCDDGAPCTRDACDPTRGCLSFVDPTVCDDANPCTTDRCEPGSGCHHDSIADYTPCSANISCTTADLCLFGSCRTLDVPDGVPCDDGDLCTSGDACRGGTCQGTQPGAPPAVVGTLHQLDGPSARAGALSASRFVFITGKPPMTRVSIADVVGTDVVAKGVTELGSYDVAALEAISADTFVTLGRQGHQPPREICTWAVRADATVIREGCTALATQLEATRLAVAPPTLVACDLGCEIFDAIPHAAPAPRETIAMPAVTSLAISGTRLFVTIEGHLRRWDLASTPPSLELPITAQSAVTVAATGSLVAVAPTMSGGLVSLRDRETLTAIAAVRVHGSILSLALGGSYLGVIVPSSVTSGGAALHVWDLSDPATPVPLATTELGLDPWTTIRLRISHGFLIAETPSDLRVLAQPGPQEAGPLSSLGFGHFGNLAPFGDDVVSIGASSLIRVSLADPAKPKVTSRATIPQNALVRFSHGPGVPAWSAQPQSAMQAPLLDATDPAAPILVGTREYPSNPAYAYAGEPVHTLQHDFHTRVRALTQSQSEPQGYELARYDASQIGSAGGLISQPIGTWRSWEELTWESSDPFGSRHLFGTPGTSGRWQYVVLETLADGSMREAARANLARGTDTTLVGTRLVQLVGDRWWNFADPQLVVADVDFTRGTIGPLRSVSTYADRIVAFDGRTVLASSENGLQWFDVTGAGPRLLGTLPIEGLATHAIVRGQSLVVAGDHGLSVIAPICPPR